MVGAASMTALGAAARGEVESNPLVLVNQFTSSLAPPWHVRCIAGQV
jgi:hypothetical protein